MHPGPSTRTILGFFPHPDDESYSAGGFLALAARNGTRVEILCATRGEAGSWRRGSRHATSDLDELRPRELRNACTILGAERPRFLDLPDGRLWKIDPEPVVRRLKEVLRALAPQVVITLGRDGVYGHEDHLACTDLMTRALAELLSGQNIRLLGAAFPPDLFYPLYRRLKRVRDIPIDRRFTVEPLGTTAEAIDLINRFHGNFPPI